MNKKQLAAIGKFNQSLKQLNRNGLALAGVDDSLIVFIRSEFEAVSDGRSPSEVIGQINYHYTDDGCYIDSGAT